MLVVDYINLGVKAGLIPRRMLKDIKRLAVNSSPFEYVIVLDDCSVVTRDGREFGVDLIPWQLLLSCEVLTDFPSLETAQILFEELSFWGTDSDAQELLALLAEELNLHFS